jgi:hypothetical protein
MRRTRPQGAEAGAATGSRFLRWLVRPHAMVAVTVALSAVSWVLFDPSLPGGYKLPQPVTLQAALILSAWYLTIIGLAYIGFAAGRRLALPPLLEADIARATRLDDKALYYLYSVVGAIGLAATIYRIATILGTDLIIASLVSSTANELTAVLYRDYHIGILSLRYVCALAGGIALWRLFLLREWRLLHVVNILVLLVAVTTAGRMFLLVALFIALCLGLNSDRLNRISPIAAAAALLAIFAVLGVYSYIRTFGTYEHAGYGGFWQVALLQMGSYLSTPFQVSLGVANHIGEIASITQEHDFFDHSPSYTTNSVFDDFIVYRGGWAWLEIIPISAGLAILMGFCRRFPGSYLMCGYAVLLYAFAEIWRVPYFSNGSFDVEMIFGMGLPLAFGMAVNLLRRATTPQS